MAPATAETTLSTPKHCDIHECPGKPDAVVPYESRGRIVPELEINLCASHADELIAHKNSHRDYYGAATALVRNSLGGKE